MSREQDLKYWVALSVYPKIGPERFRKLFDFFQDIKFIWFAKSDELTKAGLEKHIADDFIKTRLKIDPEKELEKTLKENIKIITIQDKNYPQLLKEIKNPPFVVYCQGLMENSNSGLAVVGTRKMTAYGKQAAYEISKNIASSGLSIISGLALGIDTVAHRAAMETGGKTIAVLGSGMDKKSLYPKENYNLAQKIISSGGAILSEYPPNSPARSYNFPLRNRIISGLALGVIIIESQERGGSLITAKYALEQNKKLFALPGSIYSKNSRGTNALIKKGYAKTITEPQDILDELGIKKGANHKKQREHTDEEKILLSYLDKEPKHIDKLVKLSGLEACHVTSTLALLEIKGSVINLGSMNYITAY